MKMLLKETHLDFRKARFPPIKVGAHGRFFWGERERKLSNMHKIASSGLEMSSLESFGPNGWAQGWLRKSKHTCTQFIIQHTA
jgi:hypothetical protein